MKNNFFFFIFTFPFTNLLSNFYFASSLSSSFLHGNSCFFEPFTILDWNPLPKLLTPSVLQSPNQLFNPKMFNIENSPNLHPFSLSKFNPLTELTFDLHPCLVLDNVLPSSTSMPCCSSQWAFVPCSWQS